MGVSRRAAGLGLAGYGIGTAIAFIAIDAPGGDYSPRVVADYVAAGHRVAAFGLAYLGAFAALGLLVFAARLREDLRGAGPVAWGLGVAATASGVVGWFVLGGVAVAAAEGGPAIVGVSGPTFYVVGEIGVLLVACASASRHRAAEAVPVMAQPA
jgi:hypothetical protein